MPKLAPVNVTIRANIVSNILFCFPTLLAILFIQLPLDVVYLPGSVVFLTRRAASYFPQSVFGEYPIEYSLAVYDKIFTYSVRYSIFFHRIINKNFFAHHITINNFLA